MSNVLTSLDEATVEWLSEILRREDAANVGDITAVERVEVGSSSQVARLHLHRSNNGPLDLLLKIADPELETRMRQRNKREIAFYEVLRNSTHDLPVVRCYEAAYESAEPDRFHLLLDDPSATTHVAYRYSAAPPTARQCEMIVDTLAELQARSWGATLFNTIFRAHRAREVHTGETTDALLPWLEDMVPAFLDDLGDRLSTDQRDLLKAIMDRLGPLLISREAGGGNLTLTQGDVHVGNFLYPRDPERDSLYIIDWKRVAVTIGARDLAYMMALSWFPRTRSQLERPLLHRYHARLRESGVTAYSWEDLWYDYRLSVLKQVLEAIWGWSVGQNGLIWWNHLERITLAIQDLRCRQLLD